MDKEINKKKSHQLVSLHLPPILSPVHLRDRPSAKKGESSRMSIRVSPSSSSCSSSALSSISSHQCFHPTYRSVPLPRLHSRGDQPQALFTHKTKGHAYRILPYLNVYSAKEESRKEVIMVDPVEAKRLAAKQMEQIRAKERFKRRRQIEAINGAWAMIGLTAGLLIEGQTGKSIIDQLLGYIQAIIDLFPW